MIHITLTRHNATASAPGRHSNLQRQSRRKTSKSSWEVSFADGDARRYVGSDLGVGS
jgi:hypothetical protein